MDPSRPATITIPPHEIVITQTPEERQQCYDVRINVFHIEQKFPLETEIDELRIPVGTIRAHKAPTGGYYKLSRLAVLKDYRSYRFGRELVLALHDWIRTDALKAGQSVVEIVLHSQLYAKGFYAKFGYEAQGEEFDEEGDLHQKMVLRLPL